MLLKYFDMPFYSCPPTGPSSNAVKEIFEQPCKFICLHMYYASNLISKYDIKLSEILILRIHCQTLKLFITTQIHDDSYIGNGYKIMGLEAIKTFEYAI